MGPHTLRYVVLNCPIVGPRVLPDYPEPLAMVGADGVIESMDMYCPIHREVSISNLKDISESGMWASISPREANGGLGQGIPDLHPTKRIHKRLQSGGNVHKARALDGIVTHNARGAPITDLGMFFSMIFMKSLVATSAMK